MVQCNLKMGQKFKTHKKKEETIRALIVENMQNCFFSNGSMAFMSQNLTQEKEFVEKINKLINFTVKDENYILAGKSGLKKNVFDTGSRKKYFYDIIIFTQTIKSPNHLSFASTHFLNNPTKYSYFSDEKKKNIFIKSKKIKMKEKQFLLPDHALTDGSDTYISGGKELKGIDFHPDLDISSLERPNQNFSESVFINSPRYYNRGYILTKGNAFCNDHSAFYNSDKSVTGLRKFLLCNGVNNITICGMGREEQIYNTLVDSLKIREIRDIHLLYDCTRPINIDVVRYKRNPEILDDMLSDEFEGNKFLQEFEDRDIKIYDSTMLLSSIKNIEQKNPKKKLSRLEQFGLAFGSDNVFKKDKPELNNLFIPKKKSKKKVKKVMKKSNKKVNPKE